MSVFAQMASDIDREIDARRSNDSTWLRSADCFARDGGSGELTASASTTLRRRVTHLGLLVANPVAVLVVGAYGVLWFVFERETFDWHAVATLAIWFMTLFIQRVGHRDTQAIHAKLDELLRVEGEARNELTWLDEKEPEEIERHRAEARTND